MSDTGRLNDEQFARRMAGRREIDKHSRILCEGIVQTHTRAEETTPGVWVAVITVTDRHPWYREPVSECVEYAYGGAETTEDGWTLVTIEDDAELRTPGSADGVDAETADRLLLKLIEDATVAWDANQKRRDGIVTSGR